MVFDPSIILIMGIILELYGVHIFEILLGLKCQGNQTLSTCVKSENTKHNTAHSTYYVCIRNEIQILLLKLRTPRYLIPWPKVPLNPVYFNPLSHHAKH